MSHRGIAWTVGRALNLLLPATKPSSFLRLTDFSAFLSVIVGTPYVIVRTSKYERIGAGGMQREREEERSEQYIKSAARRFARHIHSRMYTESLISKRMFEEENN